MRLKHGASRRLAVGKGAPRKKSPLPCPQDWGKGLGIGGCCGNSPRSARNQPHVSLSKVTNESTQPSVGRSGAPRGRPQDGFWLVRPRKASEPFHFGYLPRSAERPGRARAPAFRLAESRLAIRDSLYERPAGGSP